MDQEHLEILTECNARSKSNTKRLDKMDDLVSAVHELAINMKLMLQQQEQTSSDVKELKGKVATLEQTPVKRWNGMVDKALGALVGGLVAFLLFKLGLG